MYQATSGDAVKRLVDNAFIHPAAGNRDWQEFLAWKADGNQTALPDTDALEQIHARKVIEINQSCEVAITAGFESTALESLYFYNSQMDDQLNLTGLILQGIDSDYACRDEQGVKAFRPHTAAQFRRVGEDFTYFKFQLLQKAHELKQLLDQALVAGDLYAFEAITWEAPQP